MNRSLLHFSIILMIGACSKDDVRTKMLAAQTERVTHEIAVAQEKQLEASIERSRDEKYAVLFDARMGLGSKIKAGSDLMLLIDDILSTNRTEKSVRARDLTSEFMLRLGDIYSQIDVKRLNPLKLEDHYQNSFFALASSLDGQLYRTIKTALRRNELLTEDEKKMMIHLLEARIEILSMFALHDLTDPEKMSLWQKTKRFTFSVTGGVLGSIDYPENFAEANGATKNRIEDHLEKAVATKKFLSEQGIQKKLSKKIRAAFRSIRLESDRGEKDLKAQAIKSQIDILLD